MIGALLRMVPVSAWVGLAVALAVIGSAWAIDRHGYNRGAAEVRIAWEKERQAQAAEIAALKARQAQVVEKVVIQYRDRVKTVEVKGDEIVREVPVLVPLDSPLLSGAVRVLHDAAVRGELPQDPDGAARSAAPVEAASLTTTVADNYATCRLNAEKLVALQSIVKGAVP